ncbi:MAG: hypothetical protein LBT46_01520 [Planctomycetaceae bacterium]|jgi:hypothetical protein|nr:hypothetical protein [Planctomycetaceae bacterium]
MMITTLTAFTEEIDDAEVAVSEILEQLRFSEHAKKNSVALIHCAADCLETGVYDALAAALPCRSIGVTTIGFTVHDEVSESAIAVMLLTSDDVSFAIGLTEPLTQPDEDILRRAYQKTAAELPGKPAMAISYFPLKTSQFGAGGDFALRAMSLAAPGVPVFGTMPIDNTHDFSGARILLDGQKYDDRFAFVLLYGENFHPRFYLATVTRSHILSDRAEVTKSENNFLYEVNHTPILSYLKDNLKLAFNENDATTVHLIPMIIDLNDGMPPIARAINEFSPEGTGICAANIPVGAVIAVSKFGPAIVLEATKKILTDVLEIEKDASGMLIYSCAARYWALGFDSKIEMNTVRDTLRGSKLPYMLGYSCGELCPVQNEHGEYANRFHNYTFIACVW